MLIVFTLFTTWTTYKSAMISLPFRNPQHPHFFKNVAVMAGLLSAIHRGPGTSQALHRWPECQTYLVNCGLSPCKSNLL